MWTLTRVMFSNLLWSVVPPMRRIHKEPPPQFLCVTSRDCRKTSFQVMHFDHIEVTMRSYCISHTTCAIFRFASEDIRSTVFGKQTTRGRQSTHTERGTTQESLHSPGALIAASVSIRCTLGRNPAYCKSCWWVNWDWRFTQTRSSKVLLVELSLLHAVVELLLLLLLWPSKELDVAHGHWTCWIDYEEDIAASQKPLAISLSQTLHNPRVSQVDGNAIPSGASEVHSTAISRTITACGFLAGRIAVRLQLP
jgi:hypothetical protein